VRGNRIGVGDVPADHRRACGDRRVHGRLHNPVVRLCTHPPPSSPRPPCPLVMWRGKGGGGRGGGGGQGAAPPPTRGPPRPASYLGTDMRDGPGVDKVCKAEDLPFLVGTGFAGVVVSTEMLEHAPDWAAAVRGMVLVLAPGGLLLLTTRGPGFPVHGYPED